VMTAAAQTSLMVQGLYTITSIEVFGVLAYDYARRETNDCGN
jgi:hypothetical protein